MRGVIVKKKKRGENDKAFVVVVGKKTAKKAVERNLLKRRVRAIFQEKELSPTAQYVVILGPEASTLPFQELKKEIEARI